MSGIRVECIVSYLRQNFCNYELPDNTKIIYALTNKTSEIKQNELCFSPVPSPNFYYMKLEHC